MRAGHEQGAHARRVARLARRARDGFVKRKDNGVEAFRVIHITVLSSRISRTNDQTSSYSTSPLTRASQSAPPAQAGRVIVGIPARDLWRYCPSLKKITARS